MKIGRGDLNECMLPEADARLAPPTLKFIKRSKHQEHCMASERVRQARARIQG